MEALTITGPARNLFEFARVARSLGAPVQITVLAYRRPHHPATDPFLEAAAESGLGCEIVTESGPFDLGVLGRMRALVGRLQPNLLQTHNNKSHFLMRASGLPAKLPWVAFHHGYTTPTRRQQAYNLLDRWSLRAARHVVTVTKAFLGELEGSGVARDRVLVVPNSIRPDWALPPVPRPEGGLYRLISIGRLSREKAHADLVRAVAQLPAGLACELTLVGDGHERQPLTDLAAQLGVRVRFAGQVQDVRPLLAAADVFVLPSLSEGSPNVLLEAMAAQVPIVATAVGGVPETVVAGQEALLVPPAQPAALAQAIAQLLTNKQLAQSLAVTAQARIVRDFTPQARCQRLLEFYQTILEPRPPGN